jgi:hypothetical protein
MKAIFQLYFYHCKRYYRIMLKSKFFQILLLAITVSLVLNACKSSRYYAEAGDSFILELAPGLNREYILEKHGNAIGIRIEAGIKPVNKTKNEWMVTVFHTRTIDLVTWKRLLEKDPKVLRYFPVKTTIDPAVNDTIKGVKKIKPNF